MHFSLQSVPLPTFTKFATQLVLYILENMHDNPRWQQLLKEAGYDPDA